jgi:hypothetical protein
VEYLLEGDLMRVKIQAETLGSSLGDRDMTVQGAPSVSAAQGTLRRVE